MARENGGWGYTRICGALANVGYSVGRNTVKRILLDAGLDPAPERKKRRSWSTFLRAHWGAIAAMDFFTVEVPTGVGLVRYHVLFVIDLAIRRVEICGVVVNQYGAWMQQIGRNLTDVLDGFLLGVAIWSWTAIHHREAACERDERGPATVSPWPNG